MSEIKNESNIKTSEYQVNLGNMRLINFLAGKSHNSDIYQKSPINNIKPNNYYNMEKKEGKGRTFDYKYKQINHKKVISDNDDIYKFKNSKEKQIKNYEEYADIWESSSCSKNSSRKMSRSRSGSGSRSRSKSDLKNIHRRNQEEKYEKDEKSLDISKSREASNINLNFDKPP